MQAELVAYQTGRDTANDREMSTGINLMSVLSILELGASMQNGEIVLLNVPESQGKERPAIVTHVWSDTCVNLFVFPDGTYDRPVPIQPTRTSVMQGDGLGEWKERKAP